MENVQSLKFIFATSFSERREYIILLTVAVAHPSGTSWRFFNLPPQKEEINPHCRKTIRLACSWAAVLMHMEHRHLLQRFSRRRALCSSLVRRRWCSMPPTSPRGGKPEDGEQQQRSQGAGKRAARRDRSEARGQRSWAVGRRGNKEELDAEKVL